MQLNILYPSTALLTLWQNATGGISTGLTHPIGQGPFDPASLPQPLERTGFLSVVLTPWFAPRPSLFDRAAVLAEGFADPRTVVGTEAYMALEKFLPALGPREGGRLVGHVIAAYLTHASHETRLWALRFLALGAKSIPGLTPSDVNALGSAMAIGWNDEHPKVRKMALTVLGTVLPRMESKDRSSMVLRMTDGFEDADAEVRWRAVHVVSEAVRFLDFADRLEPMLRMRARLTDEDPLVTWAAVGAFGEIFRAPEWKETVEAQFSSERKFCRDFLRESEDERRRYWADYAAAQPKYHYPPEDTRHTRHTQGAKLNPAMTASLENALQTLGPAADGIESHDDVRRAYRRCAVALHPDKNPGVDVNRRFAALMGAYHLICTAFGFEIGFK